MDADYNMMPLQDINLLLANPRVQGVKILSGSPGDGDWDGPTICMRNGEGWDELAVKPILGEKNHE